MIVKEEQFWGSFAQPYIHVIAAAEERMRREKLGEQMRREQELQDQEQAELEKAELEARKKWQDSDFDAAGWFKPEPPTVRKRSAVGFRALLARSSFPKKYKHLMPARPKSRLAF